MGLLRGGGSQRIDEVVAQGSRTDESIPPPLLERSALAVNTAPESLALAFRPTPRKESSSLAARLPKFAELPPLSGLGIASGVEEGEGIETNDSDDKLP